jgi:hypothetical protein
MRRREEEKRKPKTDYGARRKERELMYRINGITSASCPKHLPYRSNRKNRRICWRKVF